MNIFTALRRRNERANGYTRDSITESFAVEEEDSVMSIASEEICNAIAEMADKNNPIIIQNLHIQINYASGGGATVRTK